MRFFLGLIAGLVLSVLISKEAFNGDGQLVTLLEPSIIHPMLVNLLPSGESTASKDTSKEN